ncbi:MAG: hypothetical protein N2560_00175 [Ignavibacteria bacterium]|nr:hypothetical protein [Ignavibacteria bacterium]
MTQKLILFVILFCYSFINVFSQWIEISPIGRKEKVFSLDIKAKNNGVSVSNYSRILDTIVLAGWSSTKGAIFLSKNGGKNWEIWETPTFFPFSIQFLDTNKLFVCGYNFLYDNSEVKIFDFFGNEVLGFNFDGQSLPYNKNFFDCLVDSCEVFACGYGGSLFRYKVSDNSWEQIWVDSNSVFTKLKKYKFHSTNGDISVLFLLGGKSYFSQNKIFFSDPETLQWSSVYDFKNNYPGISITDFWFYSWDYSLNFPIGLVVGFLDDTLLILQTVPEERSFKKIYYEQTILHPLGIYLSENTSEIIVVFDDGKILLGKNFGDNWTYIEERISKQLTGVKFFTLQSSDLLPEISWQKLIVYGFGRDGFVAKYEKDQSLGVEIRKYFSNCEADRLEVYNLLGQVVYQGSYPFVDYEEFVKICRSGIFLVVKKANGIPCEVRSYIHY